MNNDNISNTVNRAFKVLGLIFMFGGIYTGMFLITNIPEVIKISAVIKDFKIEKERPLGFEDIPLETSDPAFSDISLYTNTYLTVSYKVAGEKYTAELSTDTEINNLAKGSKLNLFIIEDEPDIPYFYEPAFAKKELQEGFIVFSGMTVMGLILFLVSFFSRKSANKQHKKIIKTIKEKSRKTSVEREKGNQVIIRHKSGGSFFLGLIISVIGFFLTVLMANELFFRNGFTFTLKIEVFPLIIGIGLLYIGLSEFFSNTVSIYSDRVVIEKRNIFSRNRVEVNAAEFLGIGEYITEIIRKNRVKREIYHEHFLYHENPDLSGLVFAKIADNDDHHGKIRELSEIVKMPVVFFDNNKLKLDYPESMTGESAVSPVEEDPLKRTYASQRNFKSKYSSIINDENDFSLVRSYKKSIIWGIFILIIGIPVVIMSGVIAVMMPFLIMAVIFSAIGLKKDLLYINEGTINLELLFAGKVYSRKKIFLDRIENIIVGSDVRRNMAECLQIISDKKQIIYGQALKSEELEWLKDKIIEHIIINKN